jgi:ATPase family AAA domain-containing protein 2
MVGIFAEAKRRKPSVLYIPNVDTWYETVGPSALSTFRSMLRSIAPTDPIMVLCTAEVEPKDLPEDIAKDLFPFSRRNKALIERPRRVSACIEIVRHICAKRDRRINGRNTSRK